MFACLEALKMACDMLGLEILEQREYAWWGRHVGDYPLPSGMKKEELGRNALFVLRAKPEKRRELQRANGSCYDIGIVEDPNNPGCYVPIYDFYGQENGINRIVGNPVMERDPSTGQQKPALLCPVLKQHYDMCCEILAAREAGDRISFMTLDMARKAKEAGDPLWQKVPLPPPMPGDDSRWVSVATTEQRLGVM